MESFHWDNSYVTGLGSVDEQHHRLVDLINDLGNQVAEGSLTDASLIVIIDGLTDYARYHFEEEENLMHEAGMDRRHIVRHQAIHQRFLNDVTRLYSEIEDPAAAEVEHLLDYLVNWLAFHILGEDQNMAHQIEALRTGASAEVAYEQHELDRDASKEPLVRALHHLFEQVSARNRMLESLNDHLEELVADRTQALSEANAQLAKIALTDIMTGLPNRRHAFERLAALWQEPGPLSCFMVDADHFKAINDGFGHESGDVVVRHIGLCLQQNARKQDLVARLGGDEFLIICPETDLEAALVLGEALRRAVSELNVSVAEGQGCWSGSVSVGVASRTEAVADIEALVALADEGVYLAKREGKNCVRTVQRL